MDSLISQIMTLSQGATEDVRRKTIDSLRDLALSLETEEDTHYRLEAGAMDLTMTKIGTDLKLFEILKDHKAPMTTEELAQKTGAAPLLLSRLLRCMASQSIIKEVAEQTWEGTNVSENMASPLGRVVAGIGLDLIAPVLFAIPEFLQKDGYKDITDPRHCPLQLGHHTELTSWEFFKSMPERAKEFGMIFEGRRKGRPTWLSVYPIQEEAAAIDPERALFIDVGGGMGPQCRELKLKFPNLPGRIILQDLAAMIRYVPPTEGIETMEYDFFTPQPVKGAKYYYMRNIMHNYSDEKALKILDNVKDALAEDSLILIDDIVLPNFNAPRRSVKMDIQMMAVHGAIERTLKQWQALFDSAGLTVVQIRQFNDANEGTSIISVRKS